MISLWTFFWLVGGEIIGSQHHPPFGSNHFRAYVLAVSSFHHGGSAFCRNNLGMWSGLDHYLLRTVFSVLLYNLRVSGRFMIWIVTSSPAQWLFFVSPSSHFPITNSLKKYYVTYLFLLATLGLHCFAWAFSSCKQGYSLRCRFLIKVASLVAEHGL